MLLSHSGNLLVILVSAEIMGVSVAPSTVAAQSTFPSDSAVRTLMRDAVATGRAVGIVIGLLEADGTRRILSEGSSGVEGQPLDGHSVFEIGSITKVFTGTLLADMARRDQVRVDEPVDSLLPLGFAGPGRNGRRITLLDLSTHYAGLPRVPSNLTSPDSADPYASYPEDSLYAFLGRYELTQDPGEKFEYSNLGVGLLGFALARRAGTDYEDLLDRRILRPLGMQETRVTLTSAMRARLAVPHGEFGDPVPTWNWTVLAGGGGLRSTAGDLLTFAAANLSSRKDGLSAAMQDAHVPRRPAPGQSPGAATDSIGLGWFTTRQGVRRITSHGGGTGGYRTLLALDLAGRRAVVVLTNSGGEGCNDIGYHLLDPTVSIEPVPVGLEVVREYRRGGIKAAVTRYRAMRRETEVGREFDQYQLNSVGYWMLQQLGRVGDAVQIFRLNVEMYPDESNPYDSLGEALLAQGDTASAIRNYERSVQLDSSNTAGAAVLNRLRAAR